VRQVSLRLGQPLSLVATNFERHYKTRLALPFPILTDLNAAQIALFEEQSTSPMASTWRCNRRAGILTEPRRRTC